MGQLERLEEEKGRQGKRKVVSKDVVGGVFTYRPTEKHKKLMQENDTPLEAVITCLGDKLDGGIRLTMGHNPQTHSFYVMARNGDKKWDEGVAVSVWHSDLARAIWGMWFYLTVVNPDYPESVPNAYQTEFDW